MVTEIKSKSSFSETIAGTDKLVVIDCFATWCGPCRAIAPKIEAFSKEYTDVDFFKVDVDDVPDVAAELQVRAMPTFIFFKNGEVIETVVGANPAAIKAAVEKHK